MQIDEILRVGDLERPLTQLFALAAKKVVLLDRQWDQAKGAPVFTIEGKYATRGWTEWTEGFKYGLALLAFDGTSDRALLELGRRRTTERMASHAGPIAACTIMALIPFPLMATCAA